MFGLRVFAQGRVSNKPPHLKTKKHLQRIKLFKKDNNIWGEVFMLKVQTAHNYDISASETQIKTKKKPENRIHTHKDQFRVLPRIHSKILCFLEFSYHLSSHFTLNCREENCVLLNCHFTLYHPNIYPVPTYSHVIPDWHCMNILTRAFLHIPASGKSGSIQQYLSAGRSFDFLLV